eukprot:12710122-Alexandrium_andersonii.AAC.1
MVGHAAFVEFRAAEWAARPIGCAGTTASSCLVRGQVPNIDQSIWRPCWCSDTGSKDRDSENTAMGGLHNQDSELGQR